VMNTSKINCSSGPIFMKSVYKLNFYVSLITIGSLFRDKQIINKNIVESRIEMASKKYKQ
ncbi:MAG: hypothetical protein JXB49_02710, partial [Bacteroidales bacterium]|nr:hypothetical protein [Bacteroidales bacterium]